MNFIMFKVEKTNCLSDKKELICIDLFKLICALLVVTIHIPMFNDINSELSFWTNQILARIAVPFFFISSGYFVANKITDFSKILTYCKRILILYIIYTALYLPQIIYGWIKSDRNIIINIVAFIRNAFLIGSYTQLWFFVGILVATIILYLSIGKFKFSDKKLILVSSTLYAIGVLGDAYKNLLLDIPILGNIMTWYYRVFETTRNGLFFGFLFLSIGYLIHKHQKQIKNKSNIYIALTLLSFFIMNIEEYFARYITNHSGQNMIFSTPIVTTFLFLSISFVNVPIKYKHLGLTIRKLSVLIFGFHLLLAFYVRFLLSICDINLNSLEFYATIISLNILLGLTLIRLQKIKLFDFIKHFY